MPANFVHLHCHSEYSLLDGAMKVEKLVLRAKELEMPAVALTDHGNMFGALKFYKAARREGIRPILGMEAYVTRGARWDKSRKQGELGQINHLLLLARNEAGYRNLMRLSSIGYLEGFYYKPRIDWEALEKHSDGLICTSACLKGDIAQTVLKEGADEARQRIARYLEVFGEGNYYLEVMDHGIEEETAVRDAVRLLSRDTGVPVIATNDAHYLTRDDAEAHEVLLCLQTNSDFEDPRRFRFRSTELYFKTPDEMAELFADFPEALGTTLELAEKCDVQLDGKKFQLPNFPLPDDYASNGEYLRHLAYEGARERYGDVTGEVEKRLDYELSVIAEMRYEGYFLIVRDIVHFAKSRGLPVGPGRGSAAGSLLCYVLGITDVDPLAYGLLFERMLNPERVSMPDIDIDFCYERREEILRYVVERYGKDNVCQIITFGTMAARASVRDVARVLKIPLADADRIAKLIPATPGMTLEEAMRTVPELRQLVQSDPAYQKLMDLSFALEGMTRHASVHAAGVIITPTPLVNHLPLFRTKNGDITSQYDMKSAESVGLLKIDILGLRTLTVIDKALRMIESNHGVKLDPARIPINDPATYDLLKRGDTVGVFQLESTGMRELLKNLQPEVFSDVVAVNALYRPGPLDSGMDKTFVDCKHGRKEIDYPDPSLERILEETYGVILYQEQVMQIASHMAGFSMGEADLLRKAMGKKDVAVMAKQRKKFIEGARERSFAKGKAAKVFDLMEKFARYGFNKSHSAAYAVISVRTAFLKANYAPEFLAANMTSEAEDSDRIVILLDDARTRGVAVVGPDINSCDTEFTVRDGTIYFGLAAIKHVGANAIRQVVAEREAGGSFTSLYDFCCRISSRTMNRRGVESLICSGAFDSLSGHRAQKMANLDRVMEKASRLSRDAERGQIGLFANDKTYMDDELEPCEEWSSQQRLHGEKEALGFFLSGHPLDRYVDVIRIAGNMTTRDVRDGENGKHAVIGGMITAVRKTTDRKQNEMAFVTLEDKEGQADVILFSDVFAKHRTLLEQGRIVLCEGQVSVKAGGEGKLRVASVEPVSEDRPPACKEMHISIDIRRFDDERLDAMKKLLARHQGGAQLYFHVLEDGKKACVVRSRSLAVGLGYDAIRELCGFVGRDNVRMIRASARRQ